MRAVRPASSTRSCRCPACEVAEACKILENTYRAVNIALVNELKMLFDRMGIDVWEVIEAAKTKPFGFQAFYPGPGLGGHCIPIDPFYLTWMARKYGMHTRFIELAGEINTHMPQYVVDADSRECLNERGKPIKGSKICILGVAYKKDVDDPRESPSFELMELLGEAGAVLSYNDPHVPSLAEDAALRRSPAMASQPLTPEYLADAGLRADRHGSLGVRLRLHRRSFATGDRHAECDEEREGGRKQGSESLKAELVRRGTGTSTRLCPRMGLEFAPRGRVWSGRIRPNPKCSPITPSVVVKRCRCFRHGNFWRDEILPASCRLATSQASRCWRSRAIATRHRTWR